MNVLKLNRMDVVGVEWLRAAAWVMRNAARVTYERTSASSIPNVGAYVKMRRRANRQC